MENVYFALLSSFGEGLEATHAAQIRLIEKPIVDFLLV